MFVHSQQQKVVRITSFLISVALVAACGGGGSNPAAQPPAPQPPTTYSIGGTVAGVIGSIVLQNNGGDDLTVSADGSFEFGTTLTNGSTYSVTVLTQPPGQLCVVNSGLGTISAADVAGVAIICGPAAPDITISGVQVKLLRFDWADVAGETEYRLLEDRVGTGSFGVLGILTQNSTNAVIEIFVPNYLTARYKIQACDATGCIDSNEVAAANVLADAIGYGKNESPDASDQFSGFTFTAGNSEGSIALSSDGNTLAVGVPFDGSDATGIDGNPDNDNAPASGAVQVYTRLGPANWVQQAYIKASNAEAGDVFGLDVALSGDGNVLAVGAPDEDSSATGVNSDQLDNSANFAGAAYVFLRDVNGTWAQEAYLKPLAIDGSDSFGAFIALSNDASTLLVSAVTEDSSAIGVNGDTSDNGSSASGAAYIFSRGGGVWVQNAYLKASNTGEGDQFGFHLALNSTGNRAAIGAPFEDSGASGANGDSLDNSISESGAVYIFDRSVGNNWAQTAYLKASNPGIDDQFGRSLDLSADGLLVTAGAPGEASGTTGINGNQADNSAPESGAAYILIDDGFDNWSQQAYIKPDSTSAGDLFGTGISFASGGNTLAVGAYGEASASIAIGGDPFDDSAPEAGAVYLFDYDGTSVWAQGNYVKASNTDAGDRFGVDVALSADGLTLAVPAPLEDGASATGGDASDNSATDAGAVYIY